MALVQRSQDWQAVAQVDSETIATAAIAESPVTHAARVDLQPSAGPVRGCMRHCVIAAGLAVLSAAVIATVVKRLALPRVIPATVRSRLQVGFSLFRIEGIDVALMAYNGATQGPTLYLHPGDTLYVQLVNNLPQNKRFKPSAPNVSAQWPCWRTDNPGAPVPDLRLVSGPFSAEQHASHDPAVYGNHLPSEEAQAPLDYVNSPHAFRTTNLHGHGLQVSPSEDDPFMRVEPGGDVDLALRLPNDHPAGLFWYHPHGHGGVAAQAFNGLAGAIIVTGDLEESLVDIVSQAPIVLIVQEVSLVVLSNASRTDIAASLGVPSVAALPERLLGFDPEPFACSSAGGFRYMGGFDLRVRACSGARRCTQYCSRTRVTLRFLNPCANRRP